MKVTDEWQTSTVPVVGGRLRSSMRNNDHLGMQTEMIRLDNDFVVVKAAVESQRESSLAMEQRRAKEMPNWQTRWLSWLKREP